MASCPIPTSVAAIRAGNVYIADRLQPAGSGRCRPPPVSSRRWSAARTLIRRGRRRGQRRAARVSVRRRGRRRRQRLCRRHQQSPRAQGCSACVAPTTFTAGQVRIVRAALLDRGTRCVELFRLPWNNVRRRDSSGERCRSERRCGFDRRSIHHILLSGHDRGPGLESAGSNEVTFRLVSASTWRFRRRWPCRRRGLPALRRDVVSLEVGIELHVVRRLQLGRQHGYSGASRLRWRRKDRRRRVPAQHGHLVRAAVEHELHELRALTSGASARTFPCPPITMAMERPTSPCSGPARAPGRVCCRARTTRATRAINGVSVRTCPCLPTTTAMEERHRRVYRPARAAGTSCGRARISRHTALPMGDRHGHPRLRRLRW